MVVYGSAEDGFADMSSPWDGRLLVLKWIEDGLVEKELIEKYKSEIEKDMRGVLDEIDMKVEKMKSEITHLDKMKEWVEQVSKRNKIL